MSAQTVNGHPHPSSWPALTRPVPAAGEGATAQHPVPAPQTETPAPAPAPTPQSPRPPAEQPQAGGALEVEPEPPVMPSFPARHVIHIVYWVTIIGAGAGQVAAFGALFGGYWWSWMGALIIGAVVEAVIVASVDTGLHYRTQGRPRTQYGPFLGLASAATAFASGLNAWHWWGYEPKMGAFFGSLVLLGVALHVAQGCVEGTIARERWAAYEQQLEAHRAERRRERRQQQRAQQAPPAPQEPATTPTAEAGTKPAGKNKSSGAAVSVATAVEVARRHGVTQPAAIRDALTEAGYPAPSRSTLSRAAAQLRTTTD